MTNEFKKLLGLRKRKKALTQADVDLFAEAMQGVTPLNSEEKADLKKPRPKAKANFTKADEHQVMLDALESDVQQAEYESGDVISFRRNGVSAKVIRDLRRSEYSVQRVCDLHGETADSARKKLAQFMQDCKNDNIRCVRIIHGKGLRSGHSGPVIKPMLNRWLRLLDNVLAFHSAPREQGGTGAVLVLLSKK